MDYVQRLRTATAQRSAIFTLPEDVLVAIFKEACTLDENTLDDGVLKGCDKPLRLSQVCRLWRIVARGHATLWTNIDLHNVALAKEYLALSQGAALNVLCGDSSINPTSFDWVWPHAHRFRKLDLRGSSYWVEYVFANTGVAFPFMTELKVVAEDLSPSERPLWISRSIQLPKLELVCLTLFEGEVVAQDFANLFRHTDSLKEATFSGVRFTDIAHVELHSGGPRSQARLRNLTLECIAPKGQAFILEVFALPTVALKIEQNTDAFEEEDGGLADPSWERILHPAVAARLGRVRFTSLRYDNLVILLEEGDTADLQRCTFTLEIIHLDTGWGPLDLLESVTDMFDLSHVRTLHACLIVGQRGLSGGLLALASSVTKLFLDQFWCDRGLIMDLRNLRDIHISSPPTWLYHFWNPTNPEDLVRCLQERHDPRNADTLRIVTRVVVESDEESKKLSQDDIERLKSISGLEFVKVLRCG